MLDSTSSLPAVIPTADQDRAISKISAFLLRPIDPHDLTSRIFCLSGAAGTGKTTVIGMIARMVQSGGINAGRQGESPNQTIICAPTNKAVGGLRRRGFANATTLDRVVRKKVYVPIQRPMTAAEVAHYTENGMPLVEFIIEDSYEAIDNTVGGVLVVVDEASMVNVDELAKLLMLYSKLIFVGDGFQLPPVNGDAWFQEYAYDVELATPHRAAALSEITQLANLVRNRDPSWHKRDWCREVTVIPHWRFSEVTVALATEAMIQADIVLAAQNHTCDLYNMMIRAARNLEAASDPTMPVAGDWLLSWYHSKQHRIFKSERYRVLAASPCIGGYHVKLHLDNGGLALVDINKAVLQEQTSPITVSDQLNMSYGHCITAHKSQSGEWPRVVVLAGDKARRHEDYWNWLYTAVSRAQTHLTVLL